MRGALGLGLALAIAALVPAAASAAPTIFVSCEPAPDTCRGWYRQPVTIRWDFLPTNATVLAGCVDRRIDFDTAGHVEFCRVTDGQTAELEVPLDVDMTPPLLTGASAARPPDANGWYRNPVGVTFSGTDVTSGIAGCTATTYGGPDNPSGTVVGVCRDEAGNQSQGSFNLRFDATPPNVTGLGPARPPDHGSWYTRQIGFSVTGSDALSGLAGCDPAAYAGPDSAAATVTGTCRDRAGNVATRAFSVPFDATAPALRKVRMSPADGVVRLDWAAVDAASVEVARSPGRGDARRTVLYNGPATSLVDRAVRNGRRYEYTFTAIDQAGNVATRSLGVVPGPRLLTPPPRARLTGPPVLRWTRVQGAEYYNVQVFHDGRKVLSAWPSRPRHALRRTWNYHGERRLEPGRYRWIVWAGEGPRSEHEYGPAIGRRSFVIDPST
jgi:hypothetical protein